MTDTRAERPPHAPGGDPASGTTASITADADLGRSRAAGPPTLTLLHGFAPSARGGDRIGRKPDLRMVWAAADGTPAVVHSNGLGAPGAPEVLRPLVRVEPASRPGDGLEQRSGHLRLIGRTEGRGLALAAPPPAHGSRQRQAASPLAGLPRMRDDANGAVALSGGNLTLASLRETLEMERPL